MISSPVIWQNLVSRISVKNEFLQYMRLLGFDTPLRVLEKQKFPKIAEILNWQNLVSVLFFKF